MPLLRGTRYCLMGGSQSFNPLSIPGLQLWLSTRYPSSMLQERASETTLAAANGDPVGTWRDLSGNARHVKAAADSNRPTIATSAQNGWPALAFDGSDDYLQVTFSQTQPCSVFVVASHDVNATPNGANYYVADDTASANYQMIRFRGNNTAVRLDSNYSMYDISAAPAKNTTAIISVLYNGTTSVANSNLWLNGAAKGPANGGALLTISGVRLGAGGGTLTGYLHGRILEVLVFKPSGRTMTDTERQYIERGLGAAYGITVS